MTNKSNYRPCAGGVLILIAAIINFLRPIISSIVTIQTYASSYGMDRALSVLLPNLLVSVIGGLLAAIPIVFFAIVLIRKNRGTITVVASVILAILSALSNGGLFAMQAIAEASGVGATVMFQSSGLILLACYILMTVLCVSVNRPQPGGFAKLWYLPGVVYCVYAVAYLWQMIGNNITAYSGILYDTTTFLSVAVISPLLSQLPTLILYAVGYFLAGKWLANPFRSSAPAPQTYPVEDFPQYPPETAQDTSATSYTRSEDGYQNCKEL